MTRRQADIEQVAGIILAGDLTVTVAGEINEGSGWFFDVRYDPADYVSETDFTRVEGLKLSEADLGEALRVAGAWDDGNFEEHAR